MKLRVLVHKISNAFILIVLLGGLSLFPRQMPSAHASSVAGAAGTSLSDPLNRTYLWNTFYGGTGAEYGDALGTDANGNVYIGGYTEEKWGSPKRAYSGGIDTFVAKVNPSGVLQWVTFLGGTGDDEIGHRLLIRLATLM